MIYSFHYVRELPDDDLSTAAAYRTSNGEDYGELITGSQNNVCK